MIFSSFGLPAASVDVVTPSSAAWSAIAIVAIVINSCLALLGFYLTAWLWQLRSRLAVINRGLRIAERSTHATLNDAPGNIAIGQRNIYGLRQRYRKLDPQLDRLQQFVRLTNMLLSLTRGVPLLKQRIQRRSR